MSEVNQLLNQISNENSRLSSMCTELNTKLVNSEAGLMKALSKKISILPGYEDWKADGENIESRMAEISRQIEGYETLRIIEKKMVLKEDEIRSATEKMKFFNKDVTKYVKHWERYVARARGTKGFFDLFRFGFDFADIAIEMKKEGLSIYDTHQQFVDAKMHADTEWSESVIQCRKELKEITERRELVMSLISERSRLNQLIFNRGTHSFITRFLESGQRANDKDLDNAIFEYKEKRRDYLSRIQELRELIDRNSKLMKSFKRIMNNGKLSTVSTRDLKRATAQVTETCSHYSSNLLSPYTAFALPAALMMATEDAMSNAYLRLSEESTHKERDEQKNYYHSDSTPSYTPPVMDDSSSHSSSRYESCSSSSYSSSSYDSGSSDSGSSSSSSCD